MGVAADTTLETLSREFEPTSLVGQYVLDRAERVVPEGWQVTRLDGWSLVTEPSVPVLELREEGGAELGWMLGHPLDLETRAILADTVAAPVVSAGDRFDERFHDWLHTLGGRFLAIVIRPAPRVFPDACATFPVLYSASVEGVASSPFLLPDEHGRYPQSELSVLYEVHETAMEHQLGTTSHALVDMVMANHMLDLRTWEARRMWPTATLDDADVTELASTVGDVTERALAAASALGGVRMGLTAGGDTRVLLACGRDHVSEFDLFTLSFEDGLGVTDLVWASALAERFGLPHRVVPWQHGSERDVRLWLYRTGGMSGEPRGRYAARTFAEVAGPGPFVAGTNGGMMHSEYWEPFYRGSGPVSPQEVLRALHAPDHPDLVRRAERWCAELPAQSRANALALTFLEGFDTPWAGLQTLAFPESRPLNVYPLTHRAIVDACLRTPIAARLADELRPAVIATRWPELLEFPFNKQPLSVAVRTKLSRGAAKARAGRRKAVRLSRRLLR